MMKDEVKRIMKLVQEGKLSPDDAAELIEAFESAGREGETASNGADSPPPPPPPPGVEGPRKRDDPISGIVEAIEKIGKDVATSVNWSEIAAQVKSGAKKGIDALKEAAEQAKEGGVHFGIFGAVERKEVKLPLTIDSAKTLRLENKSGDIKIVGGSDENTVIAQASIRGSDIEDAKRKAEQYTLVIEASDHFIDIRQPDATGVETDIEIRLACSPSVEIKSKSGDIEIVNTAAGCRVASMSGDLKLKGLDGAIEISTMSGDVSIVDTQASSLTIENKSGDAKLTNVKGNLNLRTASGDVTLERCGGRTISIEAISGDVQLDFVDPIEGTVNVRTVQGDAHLAIPDGSNCRVAISTLQGDVSCEIPLEDEAKMEQRITGKLGDGTGTLDVSAVSGDVALTQRLHVS